MAVTGNKVTHEVGVSGSSDTSPGPDPSAIGAPPDPDQASFPYFSPRRLGASAVADCKMWSVDFRERLPEGDINRPDEAEIARRRRGAAREFDTIGQAVLRLAREVPVSE